MSEINSTQYKYRFVLLLVISLILQMFSGINIYADEINIGGMKAQITEIAFKTNTNGEEENIGDSQERPIKNGDEVNIFYKMDLTECQDYTTGAAIKIKIPEEFKVNTSNSKYIYDILINSNVVGVCEVDKETQEGTISFNENIYEFDTANITVAIGTTAKIDKREEDEGEITTYFNIAEQNKAVTFYYKNPTEEVPSSDKPSIGKECIGFNEKTGELEWKVTVVGGKEDLTNVKVVDFFNTNEMTFKEALDAETKEVLQMPLTTIGEQTYLTGTIEQLKAREKKEILIKTVIENKALENLKNSEQYSFSNKAKLTDDQDYEIAPEVEAKQEVTVGWVSKEAARDWSEGVRRITWTVVINQHHGNLAGSTIIDKLPEGLRVIEDTIALTNSNGDKITLQNTDPSASGYYTIIPIDESDTTDTGVNITYANQLIYQFPDAEDHNSYKLTYQTELIDEKGIINTNGRADYYNYIALEIPGMAGPYYDYKSIGYQATFIGKSQEYDSKNHTIKWRVSVNRNVLHIDAGAEVVDTLDKPENGLERLEIVPDSIQIRLVPNGQYMTLTQEGVTITEPSGENVNVHYELTDEGFKVVFDNAINEMYYIRYETRIKEANKDDYTTNTENCYYNKAVFNAKRNGEKIKNYVVATAETMVQSAVISKESIDYDYNTKTVTWRITINDNEMGITDTVVKDLIPTGQEYVEDSVEVKKVKKKKQGDTVIEELVDATDITLTVGEVTSTVGGKLLPINLGKIEDKYVIIIKTKLTDKYMAELLSSTGDKEIHNTATLYGNELRKTGVSAEGTQKIESQILNKTGIQEKNNGPITWKIVVNKNQIGLKDIVVTDQLTNSLELLDEDVNNVQLYLMNVDEKGNLTQGEEIKWKNNPAYQVIYDITTNKLEVKFLETIQECYQIVFKTEVTEAKPSSSYSNVATISGMGIDIDIAEQTSSPEVRTTFLAVDGSGKRRGVV